MGAIDLALDSLCVSKIFLNILVVLSALCECKVAKNLNFTESLRSQCYFCFFSCITYNKLRIVEDSSSSITKIIPIDKTNKGIC